ncbi:hypothetical protein [Vibrio cholerae]|uniref:Uncharacterized protein n=1 Tax=Vibrio cholerae TaxID=666 RepID=A0ABD7SSN5_VIBCL|nr:hypothetical protein [Vibrio cholerae]EGR2118861.1 hypothetical protein [Vibrio cholerae]MVF55109.1 hypothetical protein [Vibrio cholerae]TXX67135.1 hypothetical protein FXF03_00790 [Vibrio cholerae]TXY78145.1 hypothetical protein FXE80_01935 [Vibrio cholerae]GIA99923.1 hypothetical protein VCSRO136_2464 [Vibrio cholerae]
MDEVRLNGFYDVTIPNSEPIEVQLLAVLDSQFLVIFASDIDKPFRPTVACSHIEDGCGIWSVANGTAYVHKR